MAKVEQEQVPMPKKPKGKKRKHEKCDSDDIIANKTLVVEEEIALNNVQSTKPILKRKSSTKKHLTEKRTKIVEAPEHQQDGEIVQDDCADQQFEPTEEELRESERPENTKNILTIRQKKKQKHQQRLEEKKGQSVSKEVTRNEEYLQKWKHSKANWKFEKLRQISIQQSAFDETKISASIWPLTLEYLSGSKGTAKEKMTKLAEEVIDKLGKECINKSNDEQEAIVSSTQYQRARELLQCFE